MATKWQRFSVDIPKKLKPADRLAIAQDIIDFVVERTEKGLGVNNKPLPKHKASKNNPSKGKYSEGYALSPEFRGAGKSTSVVNMTLSGDMLDAIKLLNERSGKLLIGFENGSTQNAKADGNIRGTYGKSGKVNSARPFLGISKKDLSSIVSRHIKEGE